MPTITNLTGTTWLLPQTIDTYSLQDKLESLSLNFISYKDSFIIFDMYFGGADMSDNLYYDSIIVYYNGWTNEAYRTIKITGGTDATNSDLIEWLQTYATQIIDLSNTHWKLNNNLTFTNVGTKSINFKSGNNTYSSITISGTDGLKYNNTTIVEAPSGYSGSVIGINSPAGGASSGSIYLKFDSAPSSSSDYDASLTPGATQPSSQTLTTFSNKTKAYMWANYMMPPQVTYNGSTFELSHITTVNGLTGTWVYFWDDPYELTLIGNYDITLSVQYTAGGGN